VISTDLWTDFQNNSGKMIHKWNHYFPIYEQHLSRFRNRPFLFVEIGCGQGGSAPMWKRFFGPHVQIVGLDINLGCKEFEEDQVAIRIGDQSDAGFLQSVLDEFGTPDVVIDDGSHIMRHVVATFHKLYPAISKDGVYIVEDLHTAYWPEYEGGVKAPGSFIELTKDLIDQLNGEHSREKSTLTPFTRSTMSMHFYDSVVVLEKGHTKPFRSLSSKGGEVREL